MLIDSLDSYVLSDEEGEHQASHARLINADLIKQFQNALHSIDANAINSLSPLAFSCEADRGTQSDTLLWKNHRKHNPCP